MHCNMYRVTYIRRHTAVCLRLTSQHFTARDRVHRFLLPSEDVLEKPASLLCTGDRHRSITAQSKHIMTYNAQSKERRRERKGGREAREGRGRGTHCTYVLPQDTSRAHNIEILELHLCHPSSKRLEMVTHSQCSRVHCRSYTRHLTPWHVALIPLPTGMPTM